MVTLGLVCIIVSCDKKHTLHAADLKQGSPEYQTLKEERSQVLWKAVERVIPDIRQRTELEMVRLRHVRTAKHCREFYRWH